MEKEKILGNSLLVSNEEERIAGILRARNLKRANEELNAVVVKETIYTKYMKRLLDLIFAVPAFLFLLPFNAVFAVCTYFDVGRPIIFKQLRTGKDGKKFMMVKFRNMNEKKDSDGKLLPPVERVTKFGRFMRKFSLDELLNFWSIIIGDMSIIGPRPMPVFIVDRMCERHKARLKMKPGIECPRMIKSDREIVGGWQEELENAVWYVENVSFMTDVKMVWYLAKMALSVKERSKNANGMGYFVGYDDYLHATTVNRVKREFPDAEYLKG